MTAEAVTRPAAQDLSVEDPAFPPDDARIDPPNWLLLSALVAGGGVLTFGWVGLLLAVNGWYRPALAFPLGAIALIGLLALVRPVFSGPSVTARDAHLVAAVGVAAILAITAWNGLNASQHVQINRDGGSYAETGRWIARDGSLEVRPRVGPFATEKTVAFSSFAVYQMKNGMLQFQFAHLLPALLAEAYAVGGGRGLYHLPPLLGGISLLAFFVLAWRVVRRPWFALAATIALGFIIPQVAFSRDSYSEIPSQILLFSALGLLVHRCVLPHWRIALAAGLFLGATQATRIDATVFLIGIPVMLAIAWLRAGVGERRRETLVAIGAFVIGLVPGYALGLVDLVNHSGQYWNDLWHDERKLVFGAVASAVGCLVGAVTWRFVFPFVRRLPWSSISWVASGLVAFAGFGAWILRPHLQTLHGNASPITGMQTREQITIDATRLYYERSLSWMSWYLGPLTLAAGIVGAALLARALIHGRMMRVVGPLAVLVPGSMLYLWKANAVPDHVWVTRRFLVSAFPTLILLALGFASYLWTKRQRRRWARCARIGAAVIAMVAVAFPIYTVISVRSAREQIGYLSVIRDACNTMGAHAAVVVLERDRRDLFDDWTAQAFRGWCGADVAVSTGGSSSGESLRRLAREWKTRGRRFFVVATTAEPVLALVPDAHVTQMRTVTDRKFLAQTISHRPRSYQPESFSMILATIPSD